MRVRLQLDQSVGQRLTAVAALALLGCDWAPEFVDDGARVAGDLVDAAFEMGGPQPQSRVARERRVAGDDVDQRWDPSVVSPHTCHPQRYRKGDRLRSDSRPLLDVEVDAEQQQRPKDDRQQRREERLEGAGVREVVVRGRDYHPNHQIDEADDSGSHAGTTLWSRSCLGALRPAQGRRQRPPPPAHDGAGRVITATAHDRYFLSTLSFRSSSASCALSTVESSLPLSLPLSSWRSPSRLVSSSPVTAPTACFARPAILSVFSPITGPPEVDVGYGPRHVALAATNQAKDVDGQTECRRTRK